MAVNQESQVFLFLSQILGKKIVDTAGRPLGVLADLVVNPAESYPLVRDILVSSRRNAPVRAHRAIFGIRLAPGRA